MRRLLLILVVALALLALAAAVLPLVVDVDRFRPRIEALLSGQLGRPVRLAPLRLSVWTGVTVRSARVEVGTSEHGRLQAGPVRLRPALLPLLRGTVDLRGIVAESVEITRASGPLLREGTLRARFAQTAGGDLTLAGTLTGKWVALPGAPMGSVVLDGAKAGNAWDLRRFVFDVGATHLDLAGRAEGVGTGRSRWELRGDGRAAGSEGRGEAALVLTPDAPTLASTLDFARVDFAELAAVIGLVGAGAAEVTADTQAPLLERLRGGGSVRAATARFAGLDLTDLTARLALDRGTVRLDEATFGLYGGRHRGSLALDARAPGAPFELTSAVEGVDAARLLAARAPGSAGVFRGTAAFDLDLAGTASAPDVLGTLNGTLRLQVRDGALTTVGLLETVALLLEAAGGRGIGRDETPFRALAGTFVVRSGIAHTEDLALIADDLRLDVRGDVDLRGPLALQGIVAFSPQVSAAMVQETRALRVRQGKDGRLTVPLSVRGALRAPKVQVDVQRIVQEGLSEESRQTLQKKVEQTKKKLLDRLRR